MIDEQQIDPDDLAPDADEAGDALPDELKDLAHEGDIVPDNSDQPDPEDQQVAAPEEEQA